jgi:hypothetical protein
MVAQKIKEILERDYLPIICKMCDEVEVENRSFIIPLSKKHLIKVYEQSFHCYDKETENLRWWKGAVTIENRRRGLSPLGDRGMRPITSLFSLKLGV